MTSFEAVPRWSLGIIRYAKHSGHRGSERERERETVMIMIIIILRNRAVAYGQSSIEILPGFRINRSAPLGMSQTGCDRFDMLSRNNLLALQSGLVIDNDRYI